MKTGYHPQRKFCNISKSNTFPSATKVNCARPPGAVQVEGFSRVPLRLVFTAKERERLGVLVNNLGIYAAHIMLQTNPEFSQRALANLAKVRREDEPLLNRLDEVAREQGDEMPFRLIEDLSRLPSDVAQMMTIVRRCLLASAFLGHCIAQPPHVESSTDAQSAENRLH
jgi:hypothetical protein